MEEVIEPIAAALAAALGRETLAVDRPPPARRGILGALRPPRRGDRPARARHPRPPGPAVPVPATAQDAIWLGVEMLMRATLYFYVAGLLVWAHERLAGGVTIWATRSWPAPIRALLGVMVYDLALYVHHRWHHQSSVLWPFHAVHHSQERLSLFTSARFHVGEKVLARVMIFPAGPARPHPDRDLPHRDAGGLASALLPRQHPHLAGPALVRDRHAPVTPNPSFDESPSSPAELATHFPLWDMLFGTQHWRRDEYPATGIEDPHSPASDRAGHS